MRAAQTHDAEFRLQWERVTSDRAAAKAEAGKPGPTSGCWDDRWLDEIPDTKPAHEAQARRTAYRLAAARHGCPRRDPADPPCPIPGHDEDMAAIRLLLLAVGLLVEPVVERPVEAVCSHCGHLVGVGEAWRLYAHPSASSGKGRCVRSRQTVTAEEAAAAVERREKQADTAAKAAGAGPKRVRGPRHSQRGLGVDWAETLDVFEFAPCRYVDRELFFAPDGERQPEREVREREAVAVCGPCPVREECLDHGLAVDARAGVWGGLTEEQLSAERRRRQRRSYAATKAGAA